MNAILPIAIALLVLSIFFGVLERLFHAIPRQRRDRQTFLTDATYWFFTPIVTKAITRGAIFALAILMIPILGKEGLQARVAHGWGPVAQLAPGLQAVLALLLGDLIGYWMHRLFHTHGRLWKFHAVHHSAEHLDWLAATRVHPVNDVLAKIPQAIALIALGFPAQVLAVYVPFIGLYALTLHANVRWSFGPLRYVFASPCFHRWHHTSQEEGLDKNFSGLLSFYDLLFGTFYMPAGEQPERFGVLDEDMPRGFFAQLWYPFKRPNHEPSTRQRPGA